MPRIPNTIFSLGPTYAQGRGEKCTFVNVVFVERLDRFHEFSSRVHHATFRKWLKYAFRVRNFLSHAVIRPLLHVQKSKRFEDDVVFLIKTCVAYTINNTIGMGITDDDEFANRHCRSGVTFSCNKASFKEKSFITSKILPCRIMKW